MSKRFITSTENEKLLDKLINLAGRIIFDSSLQGKYNELRKKILKKMAGKK